MKKNIILIAGLPASGKDSVAAYFEKKGYMKIIYSKIEMTYII